MEELLNRLINIVTETAPELWEIAMRQTTVNLIYSIFIFTIGLGFILYYIYLTGKINRDRQKRIDIQESNTNKTYYSVDKDYTESEVGFLIAFGFISFLSFLGIIISVQNIVATTVNPEFIAIQILLSLIK